MEFFFKNLLLFNDLEIEDVTNNLIDTFTKVTICLLFLLALHSISYNFVIPTHCHLLDFVSYVPYLWYHFQPISTMHSFHLMSKCVHNWLMKSLHVPKNYSGTTFVNPHGKDYTCQFYVYIFPTKQFFL
jgi:hypothetical protein